MSTLTTQTILDGERNVVIKGTIVGTAVELTDALFVDVSALGGTPDNVKITRVQASLEAFGAELIWDATVNVSILDIPETEDFDQDYEKFGGLTNNAGAGKTGDILISTSGIAVGETGFVVLEMKKRGA